jgi:predicted lipoprotein
MPKKLIKYAFIIIAVVAVGYNSVYFKNLDEVKASGAAKFDAAAYAQTYLNSKLPPLMDKAIEVNHLVSLLKADKDKTFDTYSHAMDIGNIRFVIVQGEGAVSDIDENDVTIIAKADNATQAVKIATEFVYGNAVRDASGLVSTNDFTKTTDLNNISAEINKIIRTQVLPPFKAQVKKGDVVRFVGVLELNRAHLNIGDMEAIPVSLKIIK